MSTATAYAPPTYTHDPQAVLDYPIDWSDWLDGLDGTGDVIESATTEVTVGPDDALTIDSFTHTTGTGTVWLSYTGTGTIPKAKYRVTMHIVTVAGREDDRSILIQIKER